MKNLILIVALLSVLGSGAANAQSRMMAKSGETVWIFINPVKADKREQFEKFLHEIFWPGAKKLSAADQKVFRQTRILHPTKPENDGSYAYIFVMDPVIDGADYDIPSLLKKMYGEAKGMEYNELFESSLNGPQIGYIEKQSKD
ncbi:hypothetical protein [Salmonirosea aquatica]|uniref:Uncharacterized protein n=1 Tax=Salmonirosea aquatica TaxID=2654236 RepID=A0A7C9F7K8_9BACT|nr:hypothetical protein [Cytophagaceae bacterium SJW1-29]